MFESAEPGHGIAKKPHAKAPCGRLEAALQDKD